MADEIQATAVKDQIWRGRVVKISSVDASGNAEMVFEIFDAVTGDVLFPNLSIFGPPDDIITRAQVVAAELRSKLEQAETIKAGDEFEV